ncbi:hypothetical protein S245_054566 [Arachis hypogaea]
MAKTQRNDLTGPAKHATCHVSIKRIEIPFLPIERGKSPSPRSLPPQSASFVLPFQQEDSSPTKLPWWTPCKFNTIPMVFYFSVARQPCDHPTTVGENDPPLPQMETSQEGSIWTINHALITRS